MVKNVAIIGGGIGGITAAFALTNPDQHGQYHVTVYQPGWRLGGKCASGRNASEHQRIQEHGLHIWLGFYDNAFRCLRQCYEQLNRPPDAPLSTIENAFRPIPRSTAKAPSE